MPTQSSDTGYDYEVSAFEDIFAVKGRPFGSTSSDTRGVIDGTDGVQWNIYVYRISGEAWLWVNLEGMKYDSWPIATFIERELRKSKLLPLASTLRGAARIWVGISRDAWQFQSRPPIKERLISGSELRLSELTDAKWQQILRDIVRLQHRIMRFLSVGGPRRHGCVEVESRMNLTVHVRFGGSQLETRILPCAGWLPHEGGGAREVR